MSLSRVYALLTISITDDPKLPIHLLVYAVQTAVTTATCIADYLSWSGFSNAQKIELGKLYVPYLAVCECLTLHSQHYLLSGNRQVANEVIAVFMGVDMLARLDSALSVLIPTAKKNA